MNLTIEEIAGFINGIVSGSKIEKINNVAKIEEAKSGDLTFLYHPTYEKYFSSTKATAIVVKPDFKKTRDDIVYIEVPEPEKAFAKLIIKFFTPVVALKGIDKTASIDPGVEMGKNASIGKNVVISAGCKIGDNVKIFHNTVILENVEIDDDSIIYQNVSIRENCKIGKRVIIHANTVVGSDGFGYYNDEKGAFRKIPQIGNVILEDDVELGSNVSVDRAALGSTILKRGVKIDNLVQIAHNVSIGEDSAVASQTGISGSTKIGKHVLLAGQVGLAGHIEITDNVILYAKSGISTNITKPGTYFGYPAKDVKTSLKLEAHFRRLPQYADKIRELEKEVENLKKIIQDNSSVKNS
ncbi:MAG: UDP-3-O-(3-hydroxymyristoyl)glucosamine N-acyltransferase [Ignavibacteriaceae bacterium]